MRRARIHELTLPLILQQYMEAFCYIWKGDRMFLVLNLPGSVAVKTGNVEIPGGRDAINVSIACLQQDNTWHHWCALGKHKDESEVQAWVEKYGNAYEMDLLWAEPAVFALYRELFQLENKQFQALGMLAGRGLEPYNAALGGVRWARYVNEEDPRARYEEVDANLPAKMQVSVGTARQVYRRAAARPSVACPDVVPLRVVRQRGTWSLMEAICHHLVDEREYSMAEVGVRLGIGKSTVQTHVESARAKASESDSAREAPTGAPTSSGPATAGYGGGADSKE